MKVRELLKAVENDGSRHVKTKGSHRQYKHPTKPGRVTIPGHPGDDVHPDTLKSILKQAALRGKPWRDTLLSSKVDRTTYLPTFPIFLGASRPGKQWRKLKGTCERQSHSIWKAWWKTVNRSPSPLLQVA